MTSIICFSNPGEIDKRTIMLMGVNVKPGAPVGGAIGFFGTGMKYAIATCLRNHQQVIIQSGLEQWEFHLSREDIRGKEFQAIMLQSADRSERLGITTELGKNWKLWMAYRELLCNALDEQSPAPMAGQELQLVPTPLAGWTRVLVIGSEFAEEHRKRHEWFLQSKPIEVISNGGKALLEVHAGPASGIYYHRIRVMQLNHHPSRFCYNIRGIMELTEDRTSSNWDCQRLVSQAIARHCSNRVIIEKMVLPVKDSWEELIDWSYAYGPSGDFIQTIDSLYDRNYGTLSSSAIALVRDSLSKRQPKAAQLSKVERVMLERAKRFLSRMGFEISAPILVVDSLGSQWLAGIAVEGTIMIPKATFGKGTKFLASTLLEEHLHISQNMADCTRDLQDWLFDKVLSLAEEIQGGPL